MMKNELNGKKIRIISSDHPQNWYADKIGQIFVVQSHCKRDPNKLIVRTTVEQAGWKYGWVEKTDCEFVE
jgi:hypothetical protein